MSMYTQPDVRGGETFKPGQKIWWFSDQTYELVPLEVHSVTPLTMIKGVAPTFIVSALHECAKSYTDINFNVGPQWLNWEHFSREGTVKFAFTNPYFLTDSDVDCLIQNAAQQAGPYWLTEYLVERVRVPQTQNAITKFTLTTHQWINYWVNRVAETNTGTGEEPGDNPPTN